MGWCRIKLTPEAWSRLDPAQRQDLTEMNAEADRLDPTVGPPIDLHSTEGGDQWGYNKHE